MSLSLNPVGGLRVLKTLLALTRGGLREPAARCSLPAHRHPLCALMPVNIGPAPALKADVGFTGLSERVKSCSSARAEFCAGGQLPASQQRLSGYKHTQRLWQVARRDCPCEYRRYLLHPFLEHGQWHFLLRGLALATKIEVKQSTEHLKEGKLRNARTRPDIQGHSTPMEKSCLWHEQLLH